MADANSTNANRVKGHDIDTEGDGRVDQAEHASSADHATEADHALEADHATSADDATTIKGNDIDSNGDGRVDEASWSRDAGKLGNAPPWDYDKTVTPPEARVEPDVGGTPISVSFQKSYRDPVVIALPRRPAGTKWSGTDDHQYTQIENVGPDGFDLYQNEQLVADGNINVTDCNWAVFEQGVYRIGNVKFEVGRVADVGGAFQSVTLDSDFSDPVIMHDTQTNSTNYSTWSRIRAPSGSGFDVRIEGDTGEVQDVGYVAAETIEDKLGGIEVTRTPTHDVNDNYQAESFSRPYHDPPAVFAESTTTNGGNEAYAMVRDCTASGFEVAIEEPKSEDGLHGAAETVGLMYFPSGVIGTQNNADTLQGQTPADLSSASQTNDGSDVTEYGHNASAGATTVCDITGSGTLINGTSYLDHDAGSAEVRITVDGGTTYTATYREAYHGGASSTHYVAELPSIRFEESLLVEADAGSTSYYTTTSAWVKQ